MKGSKRAAAEGPVAGFRRKFVITNMLFVTVVLVAVVALVTYANYQQRVTDVYDALEHRMELSAELPPKPLDGSFEPGGFMLGGGDDRTMRFGQDERRESAGDPLVATSSFAVGAGGTVSVIEDSLGLDDDEQQAALAAVSDVMAAGGGQRDRGFISELDLFYDAQVADDGTLSVAFASGNYVDSGVRTLVVQLAVAVAVALAAFLLLSIFLSRWAVRPVVRAWEQQQQFIADASHELKTPLTVIIANDSILASQPDATVASQMQWIESTETEAKLMQGLVNDMLYLAQMEGAQRDAVRERVDLSELVEGTALQFAALAFERDILIDDGEEPGLVVEGDPARLQRLVGTLVDNATKYADPGTQVQVRLAGRGGSAQLTVRNEGKPIDPEDLPHLFDRFYRADKARTSGKGGFGLGLSIAKSIAEDHGGSIAAVSSADAGTTFTVELPLAK